jgi:hypothetical protein
MALFVLMLVPKAVSRYKMNRQDAITFSTRIVAWDLESQTNSARLVSLSPTLRNALNELLTTPTAYDETFRFGDEPAPGGDGTATHRLYIRNSKEDCIALRLKYNSKLKKFHVLSFWHPAFWPDPTY